MDSGTIYDPKGSTSQIVSQSYLSNTGIPSSSTDYILPRQVGTGSTRGTQTIGVGNINIDGSNDQITLGQNSISSSSTASIVIGAQSSTTSQNGVATSSIASSNQGFGFSVTDVNGTILTLGVLNDGTLGLNIVDNSNFQLFKLNGSTWYWYDKTHNTNVMQVGLLPDGTYGWAVAATGNNVSAGF